MLAAAGEIPRDYTGTNRNTWMYPQKKIKNGAENEGAFKLFPTSLYHPFFHPSLLLSPLFQCKILMPNRIRHISVM